MTTNPNLPAPPDAYVVGEWDLDGGTARHFIGTRRGTADVHVDIIGDQHADGTIDRCIIIGDADGNVAMEAAAARQLADDLIAAAAEVDQLNGYDQNNSGGRW